MLVLFDYAQRFCETRGRWSTGCYQSPQVSRSFLKQEDCSRLENEQEKARSREGNLLARASCLWYFEIRDA
jgi:hypothetical protein